MEAYISDVIDVDGTVTILFSGCDYNCPACNTPQLVEFQTGEQHDLRIIQASIAAAAPERILFTGGEPLLQRQALLTLLTWCREQTAARLVIDTNASKPAVIEELLQKGLVDELQVDVKAPRSAFDRVTHASTFFIPAEQLYDEFEESLAILAEHQQDVALSFTTLIVPGLLYAKEDLLALAAMLAPFDAEWTLTAFTPEVTLDKRLGGLRPPSEEFLENLAAAIRAEHPTLRVRVRSALDRAP